MCFRHKCLLPTTANRDRYKVVLRPQFAGTPTTPTEGSIVKRIIVSAILISAFLIAGPGSLEAADCDTRYRIWQDGNNTFYKYGDVIVLGVGEKADLYIHAYPSRSEHPYSASADIGAPTSFGVGGQRPQDVSRVLKLGNHYPRKGKISFSTIAAGQTALGYQITDVVRPGRLDKIPSGCRIGQVRITVRGSVERATPRGRPAEPSTPQSANDAAHQLITQLYAGILRRGDAEARDYPDGFFELVQRDGLDGLISIAETMTSSEEFRGHSLKRTSEALERSGMSTRGMSREVLMSQLLTDISTSLYGSGSAPYGNAQRQLERTLSDCILGATGNDSCRRLGRALLTQPQYREHNRELLRYWR